MTQQASNTPNPNNTRAYPLGRNGLRGRAQTPEHRQHRAESVKRTLEKTLRQCPHCKDAFTPTGAAQRYCSGRCWEAAKRPQRAERLKEARITRLSPSKYAEALNAQGGVCAICGKQPESSRRFATDHCHTTGKIRGLLCSRCNTAIGLMHDDTSRLRAAITYLER